MMRLKTLPRASAFRAATRIALLLALAQAAPALAHDAASPIAGDAIAIDTSGSSSGWSFHFDVSGEGGISLGHDPSIDGFSLLVRGTGSNAGRTSLIDLDSSLWSTTTNPVGFAYTDATGSRGGVTAATLHNGAVSIDASGSNWEWDVGGSQDAVWVQFWIEEESFCAKFAAATGASISQNTNNHYAATGSSAPGACESPVCGNGIHELGRRVRRRQFRRQRRLHQPVRDGGLRRHRLRQYLGSHPGNDYQPLQLPRLPRRGARYELSRPARFGGPTTTWSTSPRTISRTRTTTSSRVSRRPASST